MSYFVIFTVEGLFCCHSVQREFPDFQAAQTAANAWAQNTRWNFRKSAIILETGT